MSKDYYLCVAKDRKEYFGLPAGWVPLHFSEAKEEAPVQTASEMAAHALSNPVHTPPLKELVAGREKIAIIIDDCTRPTPVAAVLEALLPYLADCGVSRERITFVVALGTHVPVAPEDLKIKLGGEVFGSYKLVQHNAWQGDLVPVAIPGEDRQVRINPEVAGADLKITISSILPHPMAGYGGGPKIVMPGVSNFEYIRDHHMRHTIHPKSVAGNVVGNPFQEGCMKVARTVGVDFSINCIYNQRGDLARILGGSLENTFSAAVEACSEELGVVFERKVDVTITSTYPHTHAHQFPKGLSAPTRVTKDTGAILLFAPTVIPLPPGFTGSFDIVRERSGNNSSAYLREAMSKGLPFLPEKPLEFNMAMSTVILRPSIRTILVSPMVTEAEATTMGFEYAPSVEEGIAVLEKAYPRAEVAIFPSGGLVVPVTAWA